MSYGIKGRNRILRSVSQKKLKLGKKAPEQREGSEGSRTTRKLQKGLFDFIKIGNKWFSSRYNEQPMTILEEINRRIPNISFRDHKTDIFGDVIVKGKAPEIAIVADGTEDSTIQFNIKHGTADEEAWNIGVDYDDEAFKLDAHWTVGASTAVSWDRSKNMSTFGDVYMKGGKEFKIYDSDNTNYVGFQTPATGSITSNSDYTLPGALPASDKVLQSDSSGNLTWVTQGSGADGMGDGFEVSGDSGSNQTISTNNTLTIAGGTNCASVASATDTITINVDDAFLKNDASDTTTGTITAGGFTTTGTWTFDTSAGGTTGITQVNVGSAFTDNDTTLMSAGAIKEKIEDYGYTTNTGDITGVDLTGGTGISIDSETGTGSGAYSSTITCNLEGTEVASTGEGGGTKFLRENGSGGSSWEDAPAVNTANIKTALNGDFGGSFTIGTQSDDTCTFTGQIHIDNNDQNNTFNVNSGGTGGGGGTRTSSVQLGNNSTNWYLKNVGGNIASSGTFQIFDDTTSLFTMARWDYGGYSKFKPVNPPTSSTDDVGFEVEAQSLNQASAGGSDKYTVIKGNYTVTGDGVAGWDTVNLIELEAEGTSKFAVNNAGALTCDEITSGAVVWESFPFIVNNGVAGRPYFRDVDDYDQYRVWDAYDTTPTSVFASQVPGQFLVPENCTLKAMRVVLVNWSTSDDVDILIYHGTPNLDTIAATTLAQAGSTTTVSVTNSRRNYANSATFDVDLDAGDVVIPMVEHNSSISNCTIRGTITLKFVTR